MSRKLFAFLLRSLTSVQDNDWHLNLFCKALYLFLLVKILSIWPLLDDLLAYKSFTFTAARNVILFAPLSLTFISVDLFLIVFLCLLVSGMLLRLNYFTAFLICWFSISFSRLSLPVINGSDLVLNLFLLISIFLPTRPHIRLGEFHAIQKIISNAALLFGQLQFALIYFQSGYDKLISEAWRSGAAIHSIDLLLFYHNPMVRLDLSRTWCLLLSWCVIMFELSFGVLIWIRMFRMPLLLVGVVFHLVILLMLGLVDFAVVMVIGYGIYLPFQKPERGTQLEVAASNLR